MPGRLILTRDAGRIGADLGLSGLPPQPPRRNIAPGQEVLVITAGGPAMMRWGMVPVGRTNARGRPVMETIVNARSETLFDKSAFSGTGRGVVPADGWYEWTGKARRKTAWEIRRQDGGLLYFAAITDHWTAPGGQVLPQVATVTCAPSRDVAAIHDRMGAILAADEVEPWLTSGATEAQALLRPLPDGTLTVREAQGVDWSGP